MTGYDLEFGTRMLEAFLSVRAGLFNAAVATLEEAGWSRTRLALPQVPPGGMDPMLWDAIWFEAAAEDARLFAEGCNTPEAIRAAQVMWQLERVSKSLNAAPEPTPVVEAALFMAMALASHVARGGGLPPEMADLLEKATSGLQLGPVAMAERAKHWRGPLGAFVDGLDELKLKLPGTELWAEFNRQNPQAAATAQRLGRAWPSDDTAAKVVNQMRRAKERKRATAA